MTEAVAAEEIRRLAAGKWERFQLVPFVYGLCAAAAKEPDLKERYSAKALDALRELLRLTTLFTDLYNVAELNAIRQHPEYQAILRQYAESLP